MPENIGLLERRQQAEAAELGRLLHRHGEALPVPERAEEFGAFFDRFGDARVVLLGEATHGASEFYRARAAITQRLIVDHGFTIVAVEADWPDAARIDRYVRHLAPAADARPSFQRFPTWTRRRMPASCAPPSAITGSCIAARGKAGICATGTCLTRCRCCCAPAARMPRRLSGRTTRISAMPRRPRWAGRASSTSASFAALP